MVVLVFLVVVVVVVAVCGGGDDWGREVAAVAVAVRTVSNCITSICTKTNTNLLYTNSLHSILREIGHIIQIVVHQFVCLSSTKKILSQKKIGPPLSQGTWEYVESVLRRKKMIPYKPYVRGKHVESILGTCKNMT